MADLADSAVTILDEYEDGGLNSKRHVMRRVSLVLTGQGTIANGINASSLGLRIIVESSSFVQSDNSELVSSGPSADGSQLLLGDGALNAPVDLTGTFVGTVRGTRTV